MNTKYIKSILKCCAVSACFLFSNPSYSTILVIDDSDTNILVSGELFEATFDFPEYNIANNDVELSFDYGLWTNEPNDPIYFTTTLNGMTIGTVKSENGYNIPGKESITYSINLSNFFLADNYLTILNDSNINEGKISNVVLTYTTGGGTGGGTTGGTGGGTTGGTGGGTTSPVPAPATVLLMMIGILGLGMVRKSSQTTAC